MGKYIVNIKVNNKGYYCGQYDNLEFAAGVYNYLSSLIFGEYSFQNDVKPLCEEDIKSLKSVFFTKHLPNILETMDSKYGTDRKFRKDY